MQAHQLVNQDSGNSEWFTPPHIIEAAREVMGSIDLDPASCEAANQVVKAKHFYTKENDGLLLPWYGNVWLNHPFSRAGNRKWIKKLCESYQGADRSETRWGFYQSCNICYASTSEEWFRPLLAFPQ